MKQILLTATATMMGIAVCSCNCNKCDNNSATVAESETTCTTTPQTIRLNVFYKLNDAASLPQATEIAKKLVEASRNDEGCISYDFLISATDDDQCMIVETWENDSLLEIHSNAPHFAEYVPQLNALGEMRAEKFHINK